MAKLQRVEHSPGVLAATAAAHRSAVDRRNKERWKRPGAGQVKKTYNALTKQVLDGELVRQGKIAEM